MKRFLGWVVESMSALSRKIVEVLEARMGGHKKKYFISIFGTTAPQLLRDVGTEKILQILPASDVVHIGKATDVRVRDCLFGLLREKGCQRLS